MATFIREAAPAADRNSQVQALCRSADRATRGSGVSTTVVRVEDKIFVARGIDGDPLKDQDLRQTLARTDGGELWYGHIQGRGYYKTAVARVAGLAVGGTAALMSGLQLALGFQPGVPTSTTVMTLLFGATTFGLSAASLHQVKRSEIELDALTTGALAMPHGGWSYGSVELRKRPRALTFAPGQAVPAATVAEPERVAVQS